MTDWQQQVGNKVNTSSNCVVNMNVDSKIVKYSPQIKSPLIEHLTPEETVRAFLIDRLVNELGYSEKNIQLEKYYERPSIGRTKNKKKDDSARIDILVKDPDGNPFLFIELKSPTSFSEEDEDIKGQLFELADLEEKQNKTKVKYMVYYSLDTSEELADRCFVIERDEYPTYEDWYENKDKTSDIEIPFNYGKPRLIKRIKQEGDPELRSISERKMSEIRKDIHNTLWSSGVEDNEAYIFLVKYLLTKIYDEVETPEGEPYLCQIFDKDYDNKESFFKRIDDQYKAALKNRLNYSEEDIENVGKILTAEKVSLQSLYFLVKKLQDYSFSKSIQAQKKDILGHFFEETNRKKFKESEGQFFTTTNIVRFLIYSLKLDELAINKFEENYTLPYVIDPSAGSGTFLIEAMKAITLELSKYKFPKMTSTKREKFKALFPDYKPNTWAEKYIYGIDNSYTLTVSTKVNMILHGDGSSNTFKDDGLSNLQKYAKYSDSKLSVYSQSDEHYNKAKSNIGVNEQFDVIISNPPFSVNINETKEEMGKYFLFGGKNNSENLFIERYYQLLSEGGRLGVVLPESVFDTGENKYIRLFLFKYFNIKAVVSLPLVTFEPWTSTKTSILLAQKKTKDEVENWNEAWLKNGKAWSKLKTRVTDYCKYYVDGCEINNRWPEDVKSDLSLNNESNIRKNIGKYLKSYLSPNDVKLPIKELLLKYKKEIDFISEYDSDTDVFGFYNTWWTLDETLKQSQFEQEIFYAQAEQVGYKRTKKTESEMPNDLFDIEYAPAKLDTVDIINVFENKLLEISTEKASIELEIKELNEKKDSKAKTNKIEKLSEKIHNLEDLFRKVSEDLSQAKITFDRYYENGELKDEFIDREDIDLITPFKDGSLKEYASSDVLLRKSASIKILDAIRKDVSWC